jgi:hypothetical protein
MPETSSYSGIEMADIAKISGQDAPSGGEASEPTSGFLTIGGPYEQNNALRHGSDDKGTFQEITFHSSVTSPPTVSQIRKVKPGRYHIGMLDSSGNLYMTSTGSNGTGVSSIWGFIQCWEKSRRKNGPRNNKWRHYFLDTNWV